MLETSLTSRDFTDLLLIMAEAVDIGNEGLATHQLRTSYIAWEITTEMNLDERLKEEIFIAALFHDIGIFSEWEPFFKIENSPIDKKHAIIGAVVVKKIPFVKIAPDFIRYHHHTYNELKAEGVSETVQLGAQIVYFADFVERTLRRFPRECMLNQKPLINRYVVDQHESGKIMTSVFDAFLIVAEKDFFWLNLNSPNFLRILLENIAFSRMHRKKLNISFVFNLVTDIVDGKSKFTLTHSSGVAAAAASMALSTGMNTEDVEWLNVAGYLHDIGKVAVPTRILEKKGKLSREEFEIIKRHPYYSYRILNSVTPLKEFSAASFHHENPDGTGYPFHYTPKELVTKLIAEDEKIARKKVEKFYDVYLPRIHILKIADIFTALAEDRPYRPGLSPEKIIEIMEDLKYSHKIDLYFFNVLKNHYKDILPYMKQKQLEVKEYFQKNFENIIET